MHKAYYSAESLWIYFTFFYEKRIHLLNNIVATGIKFKLWLVPASPLMWKQGNMYLRLKSTYLVPEN